MYYNSTFFEYLFVHQNTNFNIIDSRLYKCYNKKRLNLKEKELWKEI